MSLLMEALRKAEEAKRQAAQKEKEEPDSAATLREAEELLVDDSVALAAPWAASSTSTSIAEPEIALDLPEAGLALERTPSLDVPFDFHIDESFGTLDLTPVPVPVIEPVHSEVVEDSEPEREPDPEPSLESLDPEIDYLRPEDLRQFKPAAPNNAPVTSAPPTAAFVLALEETPERPETPRAAFISDPGVVAGALAAITPQELELALAETEHTEPLPVAPQPLVQTPIRASRVDDAQAAEPEPTALPERPRFKVPGIKATEENRKRESARAVFNAKTGQEPKGRNTRRLIIIAAVLALVPLAGGGFLLVQELGLLGSGPQFNIPAASYDAARQLRAEAEQAVVPIPDLQLADVTQDAVAELPLPTDTAATAVAAVEPGADVAPLATESPASVPIDAPADEALVAVPEPVVASVAVIDEAVAIAAEQPALDAAAAPAPAPAAEVAQQQTPATAAATPPPAPINITRSNAAPQVNAQLTQAYSAFRDQDYYAARALYQQALRDLPNNRDALLGLAATSIQLGDITGARATYSKLLELDPRDVLARVGLMDSMPLGDSVQTETQLQGLKAAHPEVAQLSFALGNFYASQRRWNEAQAAYYDALLAAKAESGSSVSPDFAFNLAVSLERLNQTQPAFNFYREALEQSRIVNPGFDVRVLRERLDALERVLP
jgi:tetratricopeptide (TPR) repeat protein